ncbi:MAG: hypothetical protein AAF733_12455 [Verrucomicrobiota bacterium]
MSYSVQDVSTDARSREDLARFLASFVRDGELPEPLEGDDQEEVWEKRFSWWWEENPYCRDDSPRGFILYSEKDEIVGFSGFIPLDYELQGEIVPSLVATTFFVRESHRSAVIGLLSRQRELGRRYHIIDGSPSAEMRRLLDKLGYTHAGERFQSYFPLRGFGGIAAHSILKKAGLSFSLPSRRELQTTHYIATSPEEMETIPSRKDDTLRRSITRESLDWLCQVGSGERSFFGYCDAKGELIAYVIGLYKRKYRLCFCLLDEYFDFRPQEDGLGHLIRAILDDPIGCGVARDTDALALSVYGEESGSRPRGLRRSSFLYYQVPEGIDPRSKTCLPIEGDLALI